MRQVFRIYAVIVLVSAFLVGSYAVLAGGTSAADAHVYTAWDRLAGCVQLLLLGGAAWVVCLDVYNTRRFGEYVNEDSEEESA